MLTPVLDVVDQVILSVGHDRFDRLRPATPQETAILSIAQHNKLCCADISRADWTHCVQLYKMFVSCFYFLFLVSSSAIAAQRAACSAAHAGDLER